MLFRTRAVSDRRRETALAPQHFCEDVRLRELSLCGASAPSLARRGGGDQGVRGTSNALPVHSAQRLVPGESSPDSWQPRSPDSSFAAGRRSPGGGGVGGSRDGAQMIAGCVENHGSWRVATSKAAPPKAAKPGVVRFGTFGICRGSVPSVRMICCPWTCWRRFVFSTTFRFSVAIDPFGIPPNRIEV